MELTDRQQRYIANVERELEGLEACSSGFLGGCSECEREYEVDPLDDDGDYDASDPNTWPDTEPFFSWHGCDSCGCYLGGDRHVAHGTDPQGIIHMEWCTDCVLYHANGEVPDDENLDWVDR